MPNRSLVLAVLAAAVMVTLTGCAGGCEDAAAPEADGGPGRVAAEVGQNQQAGGEELGGGATSTAEAAQRELLVVETDGSAGDQAGGRSTASSTTDPGGTTDSSSDDGSTTVPTTSSPSAQPTTTPSTQPTQPNPGDPGNPISVPVGMLGAAADGSDGPWRCKPVDLHSIAVPTNPGLAGDSLDDESVSGDELWAIAFYTMLYTNCERQVRGLNPFRTWTGDRHVAMQPTVIRASGHEGFGERLDLAGSGGGAEGAGGGPLPGREINDRDLGEDDDGNGVWSPSEIGRRIAGGLVDHGDGMVNPNTPCVYAGASLGPTADRWLHAVILYGNNC